MEDIRFIETFSLIDMNGLKNHKKDDLPKRGLAVVSVLLAFSRACHFFFSKSVTIWGSGCFSRKCRIRTSKRWTPKNAGQLGGSLWDVVAMLVYPAPIC
jgi:hypothetical protein